jgi:hypothetical protein
MEGGMGGGRNLLAVIAALGLATALPTFGHSQPAPAPPSAPKRVIYRMETLQTKPLPAALNEKLRPLTSLQQVEELLKANDLAFAWQKVEVDSATLDPKMVVILEGLPPREVFVMPNKTGGLLIGVILDRRAPPGP